MRRITFLIVTAFYFCILAGYAQDRPGSGNLVPFQPNGKVTGNDEELANQYYQTRDYRKAAEIYERLYEKKPSQYLYTYLLYSLVEAQEYNRAERLVKKQQKSNPTALRYMVDRGYVVYRSGDPAKAGKIYDEALKMLEPNQQQVFDLANAFMIKGENEYAVKVYQRGKQLIPTYTFGLELATLYERMGDYIKAMEEYLNMLEGNKGQLNTVEDRIQSILAVDAENEKSEAFRKMLLARVQKSPEKSWLAELLWWYSIQQKDFELAYIQAKALDRRLQENGERLMQLAGLAAANDNYEVAIKVYEFLVDRGPGYTYHEYCQRELVNTRYQMVISEPSPTPKQLDVLQKELRAELKKWGEDNLNISVMQNLAHLEGFYLGRPDTAIDILNRAILLPGITPQQRSVCKLELADILLFTDDVWQATLLYQQVYKDYKNDAIGQEAKFKNTLLSFYIGEFKWAQAQADILKAATSKLIANDALSLSLLISENYDPDSNTVALALYAKADLLFFRNEAELALVTLDSIPQLFEDHPIFERLLYKKAEIYRKTGKYELADSLYRLVVERYPEGVMADESLMKLAELNEKVLNNIPKAMACYQEIMNDYPGSIFVPDARNRFRILRGDAIE